MDPLAIISLPLSANPSTAQLKHRVIRNTLDFLVASFGLRDHLALVAFQAGKSNRIIWLDAWEGMASIGALNLQMHTKVMDDSLFRIKKRAGVGSRGCWSRARRQHCKRSGLANDGSFAPSGRAIFPTNAFVQRLGLRLDGVSLSDAALGEGMMDAMIDEALVFTVDGGVFDPGSGKTVTRLGHPILLTLPLHPPNERPTQQGCTSLPPLTSRTTQKELAMLAAVRVIQSAMSDVSILIDTLEENPEAFGKEWRPIGAQQVMVFRDQLSWTEHTTTEKIFWCADHSIELFGRSSDQTMSS
ncbi:hypothetical protein FRC11_008535 [Ceratobasidium sp. 423]|nr:hypothetical protein FRC11_008535 [Ceratobasidium sp. 423]